MLVLPERVRCCHSSADKLTTCRGQPDPLEAYVTKAGLRVWLMGNRAGWVARAGPNWRGPPYTVTDFKQTKQKLSCGSRQPTAEPCRRLRDRVQAVDARPAQAVPAPSGL